MTTTNNNGNHNHNTPRKSFGFSYRKTEYIHSQMINNHCKFENDYYKLIILTVSLHQIGTGSTIRGDDTSGAQ